MSRPMICRNRCAWLRVTSGLLEKKYKGNLDEKADKYIHFAVDGAIRMQKLIDGLLTYSRVASRGSRSRRSISTASLRMLLRIFPPPSRTAAPGSRKTTSRRCMADETQMLQLFQNLIGNAIKFGKSGVPPEIRVAAGKQGKEWTFSVRDNGIGIEQKYFDQVFQIFQRLHSQQEYAGAGIGLAVCKKIVERHGGRIWVESEFGKGTTFFFTIPGRTEMRNCGTSDFGTGYCPLLPDTAIRTGSRPSNPVPAVAMRHHNSPKKPSKIALPRLRNTTANTANSADAPQSVRDPSISATSGSVSRYRIDTESPTRQPCPPRAISDSNVTSWPEAVRKRIRG